MGGWAVLVEVGGWLKKLLDGEAGLCTPSGPGV